VSISPFWIATFATGESFVPLITTDIVSTAVAPLSSVTVTSNVSVYDSPSASLSAAEPAVASTVYVHTPASEILNVP